jgi:hypothetical protein
MAYAVSAKWVAREGREDRLAEICHEMTGPSRAEPGNLFYQAHRSPENPRGRSACTSSTSTILATRRTSTPHTSPAW